MDHDKFDIEKIIAAAKTKKFIELILFIEKQLSWLENIRVTKNSPYKGQEYKIQEYKSIIGEYLFFLRTGIKPIGMRDEDFQRTKEITTEFVNKNFLNENALKVYR